MSKSGHIHDETKLGHNELYDIIISDTPYASPSQTKTGQARVDLDSFFGYLILATFSKK